MCFVIVLKVMQNYSLAGSKLVQKVDCNGKGKGRRKRCREELRVPTFSPALVLNAKKVGWITSELEVDATSSCLIWLTRRLSALSGAVRGGRSSVVKDFIRLTELWPGLSFYLWLCTKSSISGSPAFITLKLGPGQYGTLGTMPIPILGSKKIWISDKLAKLKYINYHLNVIK